MGDLDPLTFQQDRHLAQYTGLSIEAIDNLRRNSPAAFDELVHEYDDFVRNAPAICDQQTLLEATWERIRESRGAWLFKVAAAIAVCYLVVCIVLAGLGGHSTPTTPH